MRTPWQWAADKLAVWRELHPSTRHDTPPHQSSIGWIRDPVTDQWRQATDAEIRERTFGTPEWRARAERLAQLAGDDEQDWEFGDDAASWTAPDPARHHDLGAGEALVSGTSSLPDRRPPDQDEQTWEHSDRHHTNQHDRSATAVSDEASGSVPSRAVLDEVYHRLEQQGWSDDQARAWQYLDAARRLADQRAEAVADLDPVTAAIVDDERAMLDEQYLADTVPRAAALTAARLAQQPPPSAEALARGDQWAREMAPASATGQRHDPARHTGQDTHDQDAQDEDVHDEGPEIARRYAHALLGLDPTAAGGARELDDTGRALANEANDVDEADDADEPAGEDAPHQDPDGYRWGDMPRGLGEFVDDDPHQNHDRDSGGDRAEPAPPSGVAGDVLGDPPAEHPSVVADEALARAQRRRLEAVQWRGFTLTGPGHGAEVPEQRTLRERLRDASTQYSKPAAAIDGERVAEVDVSDGSALAADPPPPPTEQVILDPDDVVVFDPVRGLRPLRPDETEMLRNVSSTEDYMTAWRAEQGATDTADLEAPARADTSAGERSPREVAEDMLEELGNAMAQNAPASVPGYDDPAHDDRADDERALADLWGGPRSDELIEQLGRHVQAHPELAEDERFAFYLRALGEEPDGAVDGGTIHGPTPPSIDEVRDVHTDHSDAMGREDQPEVDRLRAEYDAVWAAFDAAADHSRGPEQGQRADVRLSEQMQRTVPTGFGPAQLGWVEAATEDELHRAGDDRDYSWNAHGQIDDREVAEMAAIDAELRRRARAAGDAQRSDDQHSDDQVLDDHQRDEAALEGLAVAEAGRDPDTAARTHDREPQEPPSRFYEVAEALPWHQRLGVRHAAERAQCEQEKARRVQLNDWHHADIGEDSPDDTAAGDADDAAGGDGWSR